jgi:hypothetical protein
MNGVIYVENSKNAKIAGTKPIDSVYLSIQASCPRSCPLFKEGACYASLGCTGIHAHRLDKEAEGMTPLAIAKAEATAIDNAHNGGPIPAGRDLRLHVSGDSRTIGGTRIINKAIARWIRRGGGVAYGYTHVWKYIPREDWCNVSMFASIDKIEQAEEARNKGYTPALIVTEHKSKKAIKIDGSDLTWIPCPQQTKGTKCSDCRLCMKADTLYKNKKGILFAAHGVKKNTIRKRLNKHA